MGSLREGSLQLQQSEETCLQRNIELEMRRRRYLPRTYGECHPRESMQRPLVRDTQKPACRSKQ